MNDIRKAKNQSRWRLFGGVAAALLFVVILYKHITGPIKFDEIAITLLVLMVGSIVFALSQQFGIAKITAGPLEVEVEPLVERAVADLPPEQAEDVWCVLKK